MLRYMKTINNFFRENGVIIFLIATIVVTLTILIVLHKKENEVQVVYLEKENPTLKKINETLQRDVEEKNKNILQLENKIKDLEKKKEQQKLNLKNVTQVLEKEIVKVVEDTLILANVENLKEEQKNLIDTYECIINTKDSVIAEKDSIIKTYDIAVEQLSNEINSLHVKNNELMVEKTIHKHKIKRRNNLIVAGAIITAGIVGAIIFSK